MTISQLIKLVAKISVAFYGIPLLGITIIGSLMFMTLFIFQFISSFLL